MMGKVGNELVSSQEMTIGQAIFLLIVFAMIYGIGEFPTLILHYYKKCDSNITYFLEYLFLVLRIIFYIVFFKINKKNIVLILKLNRKF
ncbi:hypothetical protein HAHI6034_10740 [Hathewaya histolytica]|uniref:Uncharacterized protein n=1 Tax=Hathewaya histolytica TaxID=1498 RepID=A0A4U9RBQ3_HATHI|nr:hypothetical protein [Hathewaya histolytica]VTQ89155.1 Uncharacterised protein [Hathewaya histolytica]